MALKCREAALTFRHSGHRPHYKPSTRRFPTDSMSITKLPTELLAQIYDYVAASDYKDQSIAASHPPLDIISLAGTCQALRFHSFEYLYSYVDCHISFIPLFHGNLTKNAQMAATVRCLGLFVPRVQLAGMASRSQMVPNDPDPLHLQQILRSCTRLQELRLIDTSLWIDGDTDTDFENTILDHFAPESKKSIEAICFGGLRLEALLEPIKRLLDGASKGEFSALEMLGIECDTFNQKRHHSSKTLEYFIAATAALGPTKLDSIRTLEIDIPFPYQFEFKEPVVVGEYLARVMPRVESLDIATSAECIYSTLSTYASLGSNLTELTLVPNFCDPSTDYISTDRESYEYHFCSVVRKLSRNLVKLTMPFDGWGGPHFCHELFSVAEDWPCLERLRAFSWRGCEGVRIDSLKRFLRKLVRIRPRESIFMNLESYTFEDVLIREGLFFEHKNGF